MRIVVGEEVLASLSSLGGLPFLDTRSVELSLRAHARALTRARGVMDELNWTTQLEPGEMRSLVRGCRRIYNRTLWRRAYQRRCSALAAALRHVRRELGGRLLREQREPDGARAFFGLNAAGSEVVLARIPRPPSRTLADLRAKVVIEMFDSAGAKSADVGAESS